MIYLNIKEIADKKRLTIQEVEKRAGLANGTIGKWRVASPRVDSLSAVAKILGVSVTRLLQEHK